MIANELNLVSVSWSFSMAKLRNLVYLQISLETRAARRAGLEDMLKEMKRNVSWFWSLSFILFVYPLSSFSLSNVDFCLIFAAYGMWFRMTYYPSWWLQLTLMRSFLERKFQSMTTFVKILLPTLELKSTYWCLYRSKFSSLC